MATIARFEDLEIWQLASQQANELYLLYSIDNFSKDFDLKNQVNRSSGSVMDNIAEGFERSGNKEFIHFLLISKGSNGEVSSQLYRAADRKHLNIDLLNELILKNEILSKKITAFINYLKTSERKVFVMNN